MPSVQYYESLSDDELLDQVKYGQPSRELLTAVGYRLEELIQTEVNAEFRQWEHRQEIDNLNIELSASRQTVDDLLETVRELRDTIDNLKGNSDER